MKHSLMLSCLWHYSVLLCLVASSKAIKTETEQEGDRERMKEKKKEKERKKETKKHIQIPVTKKQ